ncbi:MAG: hypothetical protein ACP5IJ_02320 [Candidatus Nanoarchaeia archaeon]
MENKEIENKKPKTIEIKYEITLGKLLGIFALALLLTFASAYVLGKELAISKIKVSTPEYCSSTIENGKVIVKCNDLGNLSLETFCKWLSPDLQNKIRIVVVS